MRAEDQFKAFGYLFLMVFVLFGAPDFKIFDF
jgi:hypothetical protein